MLSGIVLDIPATKWLWKMCYTAQIQHSHTSISESGQFLKSKPCLMPSDIIDFSKTCFPFFKFSEWVCSSMLLYLYLEATPLQCTLSRTNVACIWGFIHRELQHFDQVNRNQAQRNKKRNGFFRQHRGKQWNFFTTGFCGCQEFTQL